MDLRQLRTFEAVVAQRTVTDAAVALDLAPSSVSEQIRGLERSLGVALFDRGPKGMAPNAAGERLLAWSGQILSLAEQARRDVVEVHPALRLGALETIAATHVPAVLGRLAQAQPDLAVEIRSDGARDQLLTGVAAGDLDAALLLDSDGGLGDLGFPLPAVPLDFVDVETVPLVLIADPGHPLRDAAGVGRDDLRGQKLLVNVPTCSFRLAGDRLFGDAVDRVSAGGVAVMRAWAQQGLGIALLPEFAVSEHLAAKTLVRLAFPAPDLRLRLVWRADREAEPRLRQLLYAASSPR